MVTGCAFSLYRPAPSIPLRLESILEYLGGLILSSSGGKSLTCGAGVGVLVASCARTFSVLLSAHSIAPSRSVATVMRISSREEEAKLLKGLELKFRGGGNGHRRPQPAAHFSDGVAHVEHGVSFSFQPRSAFPASPTGRAPAALLLLRFGGLCPHLILPSEAQVPSWRNYKDS